MAAKPYVIALEEHYLDPEIKQAPAAPTQSGRAS